MDLWAARSPQSFVRSAQPALSSPMAIWCRHLQLCARMFSQNVWAMMTQCSRLLQCLLASLSMNKICGTRQPVSRPLLGRTSLLEKLWKILGKVQRPRTTPNGAHFSTAAARHPGLLERDWIHLSCSCHKCDMEPWHIPWAMWMLYWAHSCSWRSEYSRIPFWLRWSMISWSGLRVESLWRLEYRVGDIIAIRHLAKEPIVSMACSSDVIPQNKPLRHARQLARRSPHSLYDIRLAKNNNKIVRAFVLRFFLGNFNTPKID